MKPELCLPSIVAENVKLLRKQLNITQVELALSADVSVHAIRYIERGGLNMTLTNIGKLAGALGVTADRMLIAPET